MINTKIQWSIQRSSSWATKYPNTYFQVAVEESCIYTCTPDWNPVIDTLPGDPNVVFAVGFSGVNNERILASVFSRTQPGTGFKLGPVTGRMLADLAQV